MTQTASTSFKIPTTSPQPSSGNAAWRAGRATAVLPAPGWVLTSGTGRAAFDQARAGQEAGTNPLGLIFPSPTGQHWRSSNFHRNVLKR